MRPKSRDRSRDDSKDYTSYLDTFLYPSGTPRLTHFGGFSRKTGTLYERTIDVVGNRLGVNPLLHHKITLSVEPVKSYVQDIGSGVFERVTFVQPITYPSFDHATLLGYVPFPSQGICDEFGDLAFAKFYEQIPTEVSILNFVWELREIGDLIPKISRSLTKNLSAGLLWWKFGVKPLISDLKKLWLIQETLRLKLEWLRSTRGKIVRIGAYEKLDSSDSGIPQSPIIDPLFPGGSGVSVQMELIESRSVLRAGGLLNHELEGLDDALAQVKALAALLGVNNPLGVVWEAIPYSFVLDWFGRFQEMIERFSIQPFQGKWNVSHLTWSYQGLAKWDIVQRSSYPAYSGFDRVTLGTLTVERYERNLGIPVPSSVVTDLTLNPTQQLLALALIRQRI